MDYITKHNKHVAEIKATLNATNLSESERWHFDRRFGIGGSDVAAVLGVSKFKTPHDVWLEKTGRKQPEIENGNESIHFGNVLENVVAKEYELRTGAKVRRKNKPIMHKKQPWLRANVDRIVVGQNKILECKTAGAFTINSGTWGSSGTDLVPEPYLLQVTHYMNVTAFNKADIAVLIGGNDFRIYRVSLNTELCALVSQELKKFWFNHVVSDTPPEPSNLHEINQFYSTDNGNSVEATGSIIHAVNELKKAEKTKKETEETIKKHEAKIKEFMGNNQTITLEGKKIASWKSRKYHRFDISGFKKAYPDIAKEFVSEKQTRVFKAQYQSKQEEI